MREWQLQDAKNRLSQVVRDARDHGPQVITSHGREAAIVLSPEAFKALTRTEGSLIEFFARSPLASADLAFERPDEPADVLDL